MSARVGVAMIYAAITRGLKAEDRLRVDALLGDPTAKAALDEQDEAVWAFIEGA